MEELYPTLQGRPLWRVALPGSHDTGAYDMSTDKSECADVSLPGAILRPLSETQSLTLGEQLAYGARFFDLRPCVKDGKFYAHHTNIGANFDSMLDQAAAFFQETRRELVIFKVSHFCKFDDDKHQKLVRLIVDKLDRYLFKNEPTKLLTTPIGSFVGQGSRAIIWYDNDYITEHPQPGFWRQLSVYDKYSETNDFGQMEADQLEKMKKHSGSINQLFLLSWTLTISAPYIQDFLQGSLHALTTQANRNLGQFLAKEANGYEINIVYVDFLEDARVTDCAILLNKR